MKNRSLMDLNIDVLQHSALRHSQVRLPLAMTSRFGYHLFQPLINFDRFLPLILNSNVAEVERLLGLITASEFLLQIKTFKNLNHEKHTCSLFQYAVASYDTVLLKLMIKTFSPLQAKLALSQMDAISLETSSMKQYFSLDQMIQSLQRYVISYDRLDLKERGKIWVDEYGMTQAHAPAVLVRDFCATKNPSCKKEMGFLHLVSYKFVDWFPICKSEVGKSVAILFAQDNFATGNPASTLPAAEKELNHLIQLKEKLNVELVAIKTQLINKANQIEHPKLNSSNQHFNLL